MANQIEPDDALPLEEVVVREGDTVAEPVQAQGAGEAYTIQEEDEEGEAVQARVIQPLALVLPLDVEQYCGITEHLMINGRITKLHVQCYELGKHIVVDCDIEKHWLRNHNSLLQYCQANNIPPSAYRWIKGFRLRRLSERNNHYHRHTRRILDEQLEQQQITTEEYRARCADISVDFPLLPTIINYAMDNMEERIDRLRNVGHWDSDDDPTEEDVIYWNNGKKRVGHVTRHRTTGEAKVADEAKRESDSGKRESSDEDDSMGSDSSGTTILEADDDGRIIVREKDE